MGFMARNSYLTATWKEKQAWKGVRTENELPRLSTWCVRVLIPLPLTGINHKSAWMATVSGNLSILCCNWNPIWPCLLFSSGKDFRMQCCQNSNWIQITKRQCAQLHCQLLFDIFWSIILRHRAFKKPLAPLQHGTFSDSFSCAVLYCKL